MRFLFLLGWGGWGERLLKTNVFLKTINLSGQADGQQLAPSSLIPSKAPVIFFSMDAVAQTPCSMCSSFTLASTYVRAIWNVTTRGRTRALQPNSHRCSTWRQWRRIPGFRPCRRSSWGAERGSRPGCSACRASTLRWTFPSGGPVDGQTETCGPTGWDEQAKT